MSATWKDLDAPAEVYDFIGVKFDHKARSVRVADKTLKKIPTLCPAKLTPRALEQLIGRLLFAGGVAGAPMARYYFALKWSRRIFNQANKRSAWDVEIPVPPSSTALLNRWINDCRVERLWAPRLGRGEARLFTDATPTGWGAVVVTTDGKVFATGGAFAESFESINAAETQAVRLGVEAFFPLLSSVDVLRIVVDNTSALSNLVSGRAGSAELAKTVAASVDALQLLKGVSITLSYVKSKQNPADLPSRGPLTQSAQDEILRRIQQIADLPMSQAWSRVLARMG
jgi:hypothetical protein